MPKAFVALKAGENVSAEDIQQFVAGQVATYKQIRILEFVDDPEIRFRKDLAPLAPRSGLSGGGIAAPGNAPSSSLAVTLACRGAQLKPGRTAGKRT